MSEELSQAQEAAQSVKRLIGYDLNDLPRTDELGKAYSFKAAVEPTRKVIRVFEQIPLSQIEELPANELKVIEATADSFYNIIESIENFDPEEQTTTDRDRIVTQIRGQHQQIFTKLLPLISYLTVRTTDFSNLEADARAAVQKAKREASSAKEAIEVARSEANSALDAIRKTAAEQGVSQQAIHFKEEADKQNTAAQNWRNYTVWAGLVLIAASLASMFLHKWDFLAPENTYEAIQLSIGKFLFFAALGYAVILCSRNFMAHKHNVVTNRHRQNALATFTALVEAATADDKQDVVLDRASEAIFSPAESGFSKPGSSSTPNSPSMLRLLPRIVPESE